MFMNNAGSVSSSALNCQHRQTAHGSGMICIFCGSPIGIINKGECFTKN